MMKTGIIYWRRKPDLTTALAQADIEERIEAARQAHAEVKAPFLAVLAEFDGAQVNDQPGTGQCIISVPEDRWSALVELALAHPDVTLKPNFVITSAA